MSDNDGGGESTEPDAPGRQEALPVARASVVARREAAVADDELAISRREGLISAREGAVHLRECAVAARELSALSRESASDVREGAADLREIATSERERAVGSAETTRAAFHDQMVTLQQANAHLVIATIEANKLADQIESAKSALDHLAHHDVLTGLPNRLLLRDRLDQAIEFARRRGGQLAVMFMDLDRFKNVNDSLGHAVGDRLLQSVATRLSACLRRSDTVSRLGGDEFVLLLSSIEHAEDAAVGAQKMLAALAAPHRIEHHEIHIGVSIGVSIFPDDGDDAETLIKNADGAMYHAKETGRNKCRFFEQSMNDHAVGRQSIEDGLRLALQRQEFILHYQPKIDLRSGAVVGVEALIRWQHPERGLTLPAQFIPVAEECGLILPIGRWVLREACLQARAWSLAGLPSLTVAVNTSALEFRANNFLEHLRGILAETDLEPRYLELELTESVLMRDVQSTECVLNAIAGLGVKLAVDDFGTGYSSLSYLKQFPVDSLKIDQSFVTALSRNPDDATIVGAIISMGKNLKKRVIAEGVETSDQCAFLLEQDCDEGQGYYFSRPLDGEGIAALLRAGPSFTLPH